MSGSFLSHLWKCFGHIGKFAMTAVNARIIQFGLKYTF
jgi:hypothetical protein